jgi:DNA-binding LacI/PurR family transcriptional regulator
MARRTTELLLDRLARPQREPRHVTVPVELVLRASHAAPPHNR